MLATLAAIALWSSLTSPAPWPGVEASGRLRDPDATAALSGREVSLERPIPVDREFPLPERDRVDLNPAIPGLPFERATIRRPFSGFLGGRPAWRGASRRAPRSPLLRC